MTLEAAPTKTVTISGTEMYYENGILSRPDGPAVIYPGGDEEWWLNGKIHRYDEGTPDTLYPAICNWATMQFEYWIQGIFICRNPHEGEIIVEWDGWVKNGCDSSCYPIKFNIVRPEAKFACLTPNKFVPETKRVTGGTAYGRITHCYGDEESWT